jgi:hypothetical protein
VAGEAFAGVGTTEAEELVRQRRVEHRRLRAIPMVQRVLRPPDRGLRAAGELGRDLQGAGVHLVVVHAQRHEPDALRLLPGERVAREEVVLRLRHATQQRPADGGVVAGGHPEARVAVDDPRGTRHHGHVREQPCDQPRADRRPVDRGHDWLRAVDHVEDEIPRLSHHTHPRGVVAHQRVDEVEAAAG